jgi:hypothetical protein
MTFKFYYKNIYNEDDLLSLASILSSRIKQGRYSIAGINMLCKLILYSLNNKKKSIDSIISSYIIYKLSSSLF